MKYETRDEVAAKVDWEGSLTEALEYGLRADDMPDEDLAAAWSVMQDAYRDFSAAADDVEAILNGDDE